MKKKKKKKTMVKNILIKKIDLKIMLAVEEHVERVVVIK